MNNQKEIYEALLAGETLDNGEFSCSLNVQGDLVDDEMDSIDLDFSDYQNWRIHKEPKWYENIPEGGVLCWICNVEVDVFPRNNVEIIKKYKQDTSDGFDFMSINCAYYKRATPLTKQEIQVFMDNVPEEE